MAYAYVRWDALSAFLNDGSLLIDNNQIENAVKSVALGRTGTDEIDVHDHKRCIKEMNDANAEFGLDHIKTIYKFGDRLKIDRNF